MASNNPPPSQGEKRPNPPSESSSAPPPKKKSSLTSLLQTGNPSTSTSSEVDKIIQNVSGTGAPAKIGAIGQYRLETMMLMGIPRTDLPSRLFLDAGFRPTVSGTSVINTTATC